MLDFVGDRLLAGTTGWLPQFETVGQTVVVYSYLVRGLAFGVGILAVFVLGYWVGNRLDLQAEYKRFVVAVGAGGLIGHLIAGIAGFVVLSGEVGSPSVDPFGILVTGMMLGIPIGVGIQFAVVAFAGAAFAQIADESADLGTNARVHDDRSSDVSPGSVD